MKLFKKVVDERQELELLQIEHLCFWITFWSLCISIIVQVIFMKASFAQIEAEIVILFIASVSLIAGCIKKGQWDYYTKPTLKTYTITGGIGATVLCIIFTIEQYTKFRHHSSNLGQLLVSIIILFIFTFTVIFAVTAIMGKVVKKKREKLDKEYSDNNQE